MGGYFAKKATPGGHNINWQYLHKFMIINNKEVLQSKYAFKHCNLD